MIYEFGDGLLQCRVAAKGAELVSVLHNGKERLWQNENGGWNGHAPILFPYGGNCALVENGVRYPCPFHGCLKQMTFSVFEKTAEEITLVARSSALTKELYPHDFSLFITYMVVGNCLKVTYKAVNEGVDTMYAAFCCHESYALDGEVEEYEAVFEKEERFLSLYTKPNDGRLTGKIKDCGTGNVLALERDLIENSIVLSNLNSRSVILRKRHGGNAVVKVTFPDFANLLFWKPEGSRMVCIEPWQNLPDDLNAEPQEISKKAGMTKIGPGETLVSRHVIEYF